MGSDADPDARYTFSCAECGETIEVNDSMRSALLENGCVICRATATEDDFTDADG